MFPVIAENLRGLSNEQLATLRAEILAACAAYRALSEDDRAEHDATFVAAVAAKNKIDGILAAREAEASLSDDDGDEGDDETETDDSDDADDEATTPSPDAAIERPALPEPSTDTPSATTGVVPFVAFDNVNTGDRRLRPGDAFTSMTELASALLNRAGSIRPNSSEKYPVARLDADFGDRPRLSENPIDNLPVWDALVGEPEVVAAWCALATPIYSLDCENTLRRPVKNGLTNFPAPRARVAIHPSPTLADIVGTAVGIWTIDDDEDEQAVKGPCATIECGSPEEYDAYGVWACMTVKNLMTLNYPELIAQYLNRLGAAHARVGEIQLLNAMAAAADSTINSGSLGYGSSTTITTQLMTYLALYREQQRWDDQPFELWAHRWLQTAIRIDLSRRNRDGSWSVATAADANRVFTDAGFMPNWFIDQPSWSQNLPAGVHTGGVLNELPSSATVLVNPVGKYALIDRGDLTVGVTGNNIYRDNASNEKNQFTYFFENFEGVVDTGCAPSHLINFQGLCHSGFQIADVAIDCNGDLVDDLEQGAAS